MLEKFFNSEKTVYCLGNQIRLDLDVFDEIGNQSPNNSFNISFNTKNKAHCFFYEINERTFDKLCPRLEIPIIKENLEF